MEKLFNSSLGLKLNKNQIVKIIIDFINADPQRKYKIIIGTDSLRKADNSADFVTAVVVHRVGNGGRYFWRRLEMAKIHTLRNRIIQEVLLSLETAKEILLTLKNAGAANFDTFGGAKSQILNQDNKRRSVSTLSTAERVDFEIHVDVGEKGPTKVLIQEVVGMIRANNFEAKIKPHSYAASKVADKHV